MRRFVVNQLKSAVGYPAREQYAISKLYQRRIGVPEDPKITPPQTLLNYTSYNQFRKDGFVVLPNVLSKQEIDILQNDVAQWTHKGPKVLEPGVSKAVRSIFDVHKTSDLFKKLSKDPRLVNSAKHLIQYDVYIHQSRVNFQSARCGTGFNWHSDFETWHLEDGMPEMRCVNCVVMLSENTMYNGALMVIPGSHEFYITTPGETPPNNWDTSLKYTLVNGSPTSEILRHLIDKFGVKYIEGGAGSIYFFDCNLMHASHSNVMPTARTNLFLVYNGTNNRLDMPVYNPPGRPSYLAARE